MKKRILKEAAFALAFIAAALALMSGASRLLKPERHDYGAVWADYLAQPRDSMDYLYLGSSYVYCDVDPAAVEDASGLRGFAMAGPEQTMGISYWYLRECLRTQSPRAVIIEGTALHFEEFQDYTQVNLAYMPYGLNRIAAAFTVAEPELRTGILFDLYFYHDRWKELYGDLIPGGAVLRQPRLRMAAQPAAGEEQDSLLGFTPVEGVAANMDKAPFTRQPKSEQVYEKNLSWLQKTVELCKAEGITPVVVFHPTYSRLPQKWYERIAADVAAMGGALYFDWNADGESMGLDPMSDYFDAGHLNAGGADTFSRWLGAFLRENVPALAQ